MRWRRVVFWSGAALLLAMAGVGYWAYERLTDPAAVRAKVEAELARRFPGARIELGSAEMRLLGGVHLRSLKLWRAGAADEPPFALLPEVVVHLDRRRLARGELTLRKMEIRGGQLELVRRRDGSLNLQGVAAPPADAGAALPVLEIRDASVTIRDEAAETALAFSGLNATVVAGANEQWRVQVRGDAGAFGKFELHGAVDSRTGAFHAHGELAEFALDNRLLGRLAAYVPELPDQIGLTAGKASLSADLSYQAGAAQPWSVAARLRLAEATLQHDRLPCPIDQVELSLRYDDGRLSLEHLTGLVAGARLLASGELYALDGNADFTARIRLERFSISKELYPRLPPQFQELCRAFSPEGTISLDAEVGRRRGNLGIRYTVTVDDLSIVFEDLPYPLKRLKGTLVYREEKNDPRLRVEVTGEASGQPVRIVGEVFGEGLRPGVDLKPGFQLTVTASGVPIDAQAYAALQIYPEVHKTLEELHLGGKVNVRAVSSRAPAQQGETPHPSRHHITVSVQKGTMRYDRFPYPLEEVSGSVEIHLPEETWHFKEMRAKHKNGGRFAAAGVGRPTPLGDQVCIAISGVSVMLDEEMECALGPRMKEAWDLFLPHGPADFIARVEMLGRNSDPELDLELTARGLKMKPPCFPYPLTDVTGSFHYGKNVVTLNRFDARHGDCRLSMGDAKAAAGVGGRVIVRPGGGFRAELRQLRAEPLTVDEQFLAALPQKVREVFATLRPDQPIRLVTDLVIDDAGGQGPTLYQWDGHVSFVKSKVYCGVELNEVTGLVALRGAYDGRQLVAAGNLQLDAAVLANLPFHKVQGKLEIVNDKVALKGLVAELHGGEVYGRIVADFEPEVTYAIDLTASRIDLAKYARKGLGRRGQVHGLAYGQLTLTGKGGAPESLRGSGELSVPDGKLYDLPLILDLLSFLSGYLPNGTAFSEAEARFRIAGDRVFLSQITLLGDAICLRGQGSMKSDGSELDLDMYGLLWGRVMPLLPPVIDAIPPAISKNLMRIKLQGSLDKAKPKIEPLPALVEPLKEFLQFISRRQQGKK